MSEKILYIHIGCHKTGTTSIQHSLVKNKTNLEKNNFVFFYENYATGNNEFPDLHSWLKYVDNTKVVPNGLKLINPDKFRKKLSSIEKNIILSSENFSFFFDINHIIELKESINDLFNTIKIVCYIRRQDQHIISHHREGSKISWIAEHDLFGHGTRLIPQYEKKHDLYLDYNQRLAKWGDVFGDDNMIIKIYERKILKNNDSIDDFFEIIKLNDYHKYIDKNISSRLIKFKLGHLISCSSVRDKQLLHDLLTKNISNDYDGLPSKKEAIKFYERYSHSNIELNKRFKINNNEKLFDDDFTMYPEKSTDVWVEKTANSAINDLIASYDKLLESSEIDTLVQSAIDLERVNISMSYRLMTLAQKFRPHGPLIQKKLAEYRQILA